MKIFTFTKFGRALLSAAIFICVVVTTAVTQAVTPVQQVQGKPKIAVYVFGAETPALNETMTIHLLTALANSGRYQAVENHMDFFNKAAEERKGGAASVDAKIKRLGQQFGVEYVCVAEVTTVFGETQVTAHIYDVNTAKITAMGVSDMPLRTPAELTAASQQIVNAMFKNAQPSAPVSAYQPTQRPNINTPPETFGSGTTPQGNSEVSPTRGAEAANRQSPKTLPQDYTNNSGKVVSLTIYVPQSTGLAKEQNYIPALVQGEFVSNFSKYSAISILDWERLDDIYTKLVDEAYDDKAEAKQDVVLGRLAPTSHFLTGNITKTATGYNIKMNITATADKMTVASYSGTFSFAELDNLTGIRRASLELLQKVGVELTDNAKQELAGAAEANQVSAQTALAKGVTAQRAGTEVAALSYFYQAAAFNPALKEAVKRSSIAAANIKSGNIGADLRNDIVWRKNWVARLKETEESVYGMIAIIMANAADPPYALTYFTDIKTGNVNYQTETADLSITISLGTNEAWFAAMRKTLDAAAQAVSAVLDGLNATNRKNEWGLARWPRDGVSNTNPFASASKKGHDIAVAFELVNQQGRAIGRQTVKLNPGFSIERTDGGRFAVAVSGDDVGTVSFKGVSANDISDNLTIRVASVNGVPPQQARFAIAASALFEKSPPFTDARNGKRYNTVKIGGKMWMAENLNYQPSVGNSWCHNDDNFNCNRYGRQYDWNTAMSACPAGWHLPTRWEWNNLVDLAGGMVGKTLRSTSGWHSGGNGTDTYGFSALPGGGRGFPGGFGWAGSNGYWWTATETSSGSAYYRGMAFYSYNDLGDHGAIDKTFGFSVRCVADE